MVNPTMCAVDLASMTRQDAIVECRPSVAEDVA